MSNSGRKNFGEYPDEQAVIQIIKIKRRIRKGRGAETTYAQIARELNAEGYETQTKKPWYPQIIAKILNRPEKVKKKQAVRHGLGVHDFLSKEQLRNCRLVCPGRDRMIFELLVTVGLRAAELLSLELQDIGIEQGKSQIDIRGKGGGGEVTRSNEISAGLADQMRSYLKENRPVAEAEEPVFLNVHGRPLKYKALLERIKSIGEKAGVNWLRPHKLRHTAAVFLYNYSLDILAVKKFLGHKSVKTTEIYADTLESKKKEQAEGLFKALKTE